MQVPTYNGQQVQSEVVRQPRPTADSFGAGQAQQLGQFSKAVFDESVELQKTQARQRLNEVIPQIDGEFQKFKASFQGVDATPEAFSAFEDHYKKRVEEASSDLPMYAQTMVLDDLSTKRAGYSIDWNSHSVAQTEKARVQSIASENDRFKNEIASGSQFDELGTDKTEYIKHNVAEINKGQTPEFIANEQAKAVGDAHFSRAFNLGQTNPAEGLKYLNDHRAELEKYNPVAAARLDEDLSRASLQESALTAGMTIAESGAIGADAEAEIAKQPEDQRDMVRESYSTAVTQKEVEVNQAVAAGYKNAYDYILDPKTPLSALASFKAAPGTPDSVARSQEALARERIYASAGKATKTNWGRYSSLSVMAEANPVEFSNIDLSGEKLASSELEELVKRQIQIKTSGFAKVDDKDINLAVDTALASVKVKGDADQTYMHTSIRRWAEAFKSEKGREPSPEELRTKANNLLLIQKGGFGKPDRRGYEIEALSETPFKADHVFTRSYLEIPEDKRIKYSEHLGYYGFTFVDNKIEYENVEKLDAAIASGKYRIDAPVPTKDRIEIQNRLHKEGKTVVDDKRIRKEYIESFLRAPVQDTRSLKTLKSEKEKLEKEIQELETALGADLKDVTFADWVTNSKKSNIAMNRGKGDFSQQQEFERYSSKYQTELAIKKSKLEKLNAALSNR